LYVFVGCIGITLISVTKSWSGSDHCPFWIRYWFCITTHLCRLLLDVFVWETIFKKAYGSRNQIRLVHNLAGMRTCQPLRFWRNFYAF